MPRNKTQFQKGFSLNKFIKQHGTEDQCFDVLYNWRWPTEFRCSKCSHTKYCQLSSLKLLQCDRCHHQTSLTAGAIFESCKLPLTRWFRGIYLITQDKKGISAMKLRRHLLISYNAVWHMKHNLMKVMVKRASKKKLSGFIEFNDAYLGGESRGCKRGRGASDTTPLVAAVETSSDGCGMRIILSVIRGFRKAAIVSRSQRHLLKGSVLITDGPACFNAVTDAGCLHDKIVCGGGSAFVQNVGFYWVNTILSNLKASLRSTYHAIRPKYAQRYLSEFQCRLNRQFDLCALIPKHSLCHS